MPNLIQPSSLHGPLFSSAKMRALVSDHARVQRMLDVEAALARAEEAEGVIPLGVAAVIRKACDADLYDLAAIGEATAQSGVVAIPLVDALRALVHESDPRAADFVHWGATSQDIVDTALVIELRAGIDLLVGDLDRAAKAFAADAERYRRTQMAGRTWLQHAVPIPLGLKFAGYAAALIRSRERLIRMRTEALVLQFGGAAGTLAPLADKGIAVSQRLAEELDLALPDAPWHTHRDRLAEVASVVAILSGACGKIARDVALMMQTEVAEAFEPAAQGRGGSSTMPQKRNPVLASTAMAAATAAPHFAATILSAQMQEHERAAGIWPVEWITFPPLTLLASGAMTAVADIAEGLGVNEARMLANLEASGGAIMAEAVSFALAPKLGKREAHSVLAAAARSAAASHRHLKEVLMDDKRVTSALSPEALAQLFDPLNYQGAAQNFIDRLLNRSKF